MSSLGSSGISSAAVSSGVSSVSDASSDSLISSASCRQDVRYIIGELIGELNTSHTYIFGGDVQRRADRVNVGMLGVDWKVDKKSNRYQFEKIYTVGDWTSQTFSPLAKPGISVNKNDYLLAVNGVDVKANKNIWK